MMSTVFLSVLMVFLYTCSARFLLQEVQQFTGCETKYTVKIGDVLVQIAVDQGVSLNNLILVNPQITDIDVIFPGDEINIPPCEQGSSEPDTQQSSKLDQRAYPVPTTMDTVLSAPTSEACQDVQPPGSAFDCQTQAQLGLCDTIPTSFCMKSCGQCCTDIQLSEATTCDVVVSRQLCDDPEIVENDICSLSCNRCLEQKAQSMDLLAAQTRLDSSPVPGESPWELRIVDFTTESGGYIANGSAFNYCTQSIHATSAFLEKVDQIANKLGVQGNQLMALMDFESTIDPSIQNPLSGATGLIQFIEPTAISLGTSTTELKSMNAVMQLDFVYTYLAEYITPGATLADMYLAILYPEAVGKPDDFVLFSSPDVAYQQNSVLDINGDGSVTKIEAAFYPQQRYNQFGLGCQAQGSFGTLD